MFRVFCFSFVLLFALSTNVWATKPDDIISWDDVRAEMLGTQIVSEQTDKGSSVKIQAKGLTTVNLTQVDVKARNLNDTVLKYSAELKASDLKGQAYLEMLVHFDDQAYFSRSLQTPLEGTTDWKMVETPFVLKDGKVPDKVTLNLVINGTGTVWVRSVHLK